MKEDREISETEARKIIITYARYTAAAGLLTATDGNLSLRLDNDSVLITPSGVPKAIVEASQLVVVDLNGAVLSGEGTPSSEGKLHYEVYKSRPDIKAVIHAHPPKTIAYSLAGMNLDSCLMPEYALVLGQTPTAPYATPGSQELPLSIRDYIARSDAIILARHGSLTVGKTMNDAFMLLERLEMSAAVGIYTRILHSPVPYPEGEMEKLHSFHQGRGLPYRKISCTHAVAAASSAKQEKKTELDLAAQNTEKKTIKKESSSMLERVMQNVYKDELN